MPARNEINTTAIHTDFTIVREKIENHSVSFRRRGAFNGVEWAARSASGSAAFHTPLPLNDAVILNTYFARLNSARD